MQMFYGYMKLFVIIALAGLAGVGGGLQLGSTAATVQLSVVLCLQLGLPLFILFTRADSDRVLGYLVAFQLLCEGLSTASLLLTSLSDGLAPLMVRIVSRTRPTTPHSCDGAALPLSPHDLRQDRSPIVTHI